MLLDERACSYKFSRSILAGTCVHFIAVLVQSGSLISRKSARLRSLAAWTRESVLQLGPTFIKLGQLFSTRSDLFPAEFTEASLMPHIPEPCFRVASSMPSMEVT